MLLFKEAPLTAPLGSPTVHPAGGTTLLASLYLATGWFEDLGNLGPVSVLEFVLAPRCLQKTPSNLVYKKQLAQKVWPKPPKSSGGFNAAWHQEPSPPPFLLWGRINRGGHDTDFPPPGCCPSRLPGGPGRRVCDKDPTLRSITSTAFRWGGHMSTYCGCQT